MRSNDDHNDSSGSLPEKPGLDARVLRIAAVVVLGTIMSILDTTIVNVAIRTLARDFNASLPTTQWVATGYMLALATVIPLTGWVADRFGTKRLYMMSIALFLLGSALCGAAWSIGSLILFRVLQGFGGGMIMPAGMTILSHAAGSQRVGRLMGIIGIPMLLGPICGPILGGWLVDDVSWRWIFFVNIPIGFIALLAAQRILEPDAPKPHHRLDWLGLLLLSPGLAIFVFGLAETAAAGNLDSARSDFCLLVGGVMIMSFIWHARQRHDALIDVRLFARRTVGAAAMTTFLFGTAFFGMALLMPLYFQIVRGEAAFGAGLRLAPQGLGAMLAMPIASRLTDRTGAGTVVLVGLTAVAIAFAMLSQVHHDTPLMPLEIALFLNGIGMGCVMMPSMSAAMSGLQRHEIARATSGLNVIQRVGGSIGTALLAVILSHEMASAMPGTSFSLRGTHGALPASALEPLSRAFGHTFIYALGIVIVAFGAAMLLPRYKTAPKAERR